MLELRVQRLSAARTENKEISNWQRKVLTKHIWYGRMYLVEKTMITLKNVKIYDASLGPEIEDYT